MVGKPITTIIPPDRQDEEAEILARIRSGELFDHFDTVRLRKNGITIDISLTVSPIRDSQGRIIGASKIARDITAQKRQADRLVFLMRELSHRTNNLLTIIQSIARQTARSSDSYDSFQEKFNARLQGLAHSNRLLMEHNWSGASLDQLVRLQLRPFVEDGSNRIVIEGPPVMLAVDAVQSMGLALHELATNASKHGALSCASGKVYIRWKLPEGEAEPHFRLVWEERDGPPAKQPSRTGFGTIVLEEMTRKALACKTETEFAIEGLCWILMCPVHRILHVDWPTRGE